MESPCNLLTNLNLHGASYGHTIVSEFVWGWGTLHLVVLLRKYTHEAFSDVDSLCLVKKCRELEMPRE